MSKVFTITEGLENMGAVKTGGQGSVYKGRRTGEIITAVKLLPTPIFNQSNEDKHYRDFKNEVEKLSRVNEKPNPNVVKILSHGVSETGCFPYIEMEYIDGPDLAELLKPPHQSVFTIKEIIKVANHLSNALAHCHQLGVKHGDLKSNNVKFNESTGNYVLLDFGLAILSDEERRTSMRHAGAIEFMAPEQNEGQVLFETDVYSFGIILYELLAGQVPFILDGNSETGRNRVMIAHMETSPADPLALRAAALPGNWTDQQKAMEMKVPDWLLNLVTKCLQKKPLDRFANGLMLHNFISDHHIHTADTVELVKSEEQKWGGVLAAKDRELQLMRERLAATETKQPVYTAPLTEYSQPKGVSRAAFSAVLLLLLLVGAFTVYSLFFNKPTVGSI
ncbi:MAG TPA: serine/threonine-protein kinase, partial [Flavisolibacter sp.]|nr:serine/threonine-protein kinase [Flavisolibacter sp.]